MDKNQIRIRRGRNGTLSVFLNGEKVRGVRNISYSFGHGKCPVINLELVATNVEIDSEI